MSGTFPKGTLSSLPPRHITHQERANHAQALAQTITGTQTKLARRTPHYAPDPMSVRGIPAVGPNCPGRINGTRPDQICDR